MIGATWILACTLALDGGGDAAARVQVASFLEMWCLDCHSGAKPKGALDLQASLDHLRLDGDAASLDAADRSLLRLARRRVASGQMPPPRAKERPDAEQVRAALGSFDGVLHPRDPALPPAGGAPRRLNRTEYANTVRDLLGVDIARLGTLAPDDVGAGFDNIGAVLSMAPSSFERTLDLAEAIAMDAAPPEVRIVDGKPPRQVLRGSALTADAAYAHRTKDATILFSNGAAHSGVRLPRDGTYALRCVACGTQAGSEPVKLALQVDGKTLAEVEVPETQDAPGTRRLEVQLRGGRRIIAVNFLNDYYVAARAPDKRAQDRNAIILELSVEGPLDSRPTPAWRTQMEAASATLESAARERANFAYLVERFLRRPVAEADIALCERVAAAAGGAASTDPDARLRAVLTALLVHPEFLFRIERDPPPGERARNLSGAELATRLSYFLWASTPDDALRAAAARGELATDAGRREAVARLLADPRASSLAERFATQWLGIDGVEQRTPDPAQFPGVDAALLASMRAETVLLFESVLREGRPVWALLNADYTFVDERLARHYGMPVPAGADRTLRRVPVDPARGGGVLAHASVLVCTSNPTRTSPVKRGKWVLDALLDDAPPPPPPGTPQLPEAVPGGEHPSMRQLLAAHRADPSCAACHRRMDALGFAFEAYDPVGRRRDRADGAVVDPRGDLPDGREVVDIAGVRATLMGDRAFLRSLVKHLLIYATGRALEAEDDAALDSMVDSLRAAPTLNDIVLAIVQSPDFRMRGVS